VRVRTFGEVIRLYRVHPEAKSLDPDGERCGRQTRGLLKRRPVRASYLTHIGKEANSLEEIATGMVRDEDEVLNEYQDPERDPFTNLVVPVLKQMPLDELQAMSGMGKSALIEIRQRRSVPHHGNRDGLERVAADWVRAQDPSRATVDDHLSVLAAFVNAATRSTSGRAHEPEL